MRRNPSDLSTVPTGPGIYRFLSPGGEVLYVGKSRNLRRRLAQYYAGRDHLWVPDLFALAGSVDWERTPTEEDALLREYELIQRFRPRLNIRLKDDRRYPCLDLSLAHPWPVFGLRRTPTPGGFHLGPITRLYGLRQMVDQLNRLLKLRRCSDKVFARHQGCILGQTEVCSAPCLGRIPAEEYRRRVRLLLTVLRGHKRLFLRWLEREMRALAASEAYEAAQERKEALEQLRAFDPSRFYRFRGEGEMDALAAVSLGPGSGLGVVLEVRGGEVARREVVAFPMDLSGEDDPLERLVLQHYAHHPVPGELLVAEEGRRDLSLLLRAMRGRSVQVHLPQRGGRLRFLERAREILALQVQDRSWGTVARALAGRLGVAPPPGRVEALDISHQGERERVGAVAVFVEGVVRPAACRVYALDGAPPGDTGALGALVRRRYREGGRGADLLLVDGGLTQWLAVRGALDALGLKVPVLALAKREERVFLAPDRGELWDLYAPERLFLQEARDEVHRRAIRAHRLRRRRALLSGGDPPPGGRGRRNRGTCAPDAEPGSSGNSGPQT